MKETKTYCDRCKKGIVEPTGFFRFGVGSWLPLEILELCDPCYETARTFFYGFKNSNYSQSATPTPSKDTTSKE
jgi:hypothetical protein